jgi:hypothetical protein
MGTTDVVAIPLNLCAEDRPMILDLLDGDNTCNPQKVMHSEESWVLAWVLNLLSPWVIKRRHDAIGIRRKKAGQAHLHLVKVLDHVYLLLYRWRGRTPLPQRAPKLWLLPSSIRKLQTPGVVDIDERTVFLSAVPISLALHLVTCAYAHLIASLNYYLSWDKDL